MVVQCRIMFYRSSPNSILHQSCLGSASSARTRYRQSSKLKPLLECEKQDRRILVGRSRILGNGGGMNSVTVDLLLAVHGDLFALRLRYERSKPG